MYLNHTPTPSTPTNTYNSTPDSAINCDTFDQLNTFAKCIYRDDISSHLNYVYSGLFLLYILLLLITLRNLYKVSRISRQRSKVVIYCFINTLICFATLLRLIFYTDGITALSINWKFPLFVYLALDSSSILILNTAMVLGAYSWISGLLTRTFNSTKRPYFKAICILLIVLNFVFYGLLNTQYLYYGLKDSMVIQKIKSEFNILPSFLLDVGTAADGIYFTFACLMMWSYLQNEKGNKSVILDRLVLISGVLSFLRVGQNPLGVHVAWFKTIRKDSIINEDWIWPMCNLLYTVMTEVFPTLILSMKFSLKSKVVSTASTKIMTEEELDAESIRCASSISANVSLMSRASDMSFAQDYDNIGTLQYQNKK